MCRAMLSASPTRCIVQKKGGMPEVLELWNVGLLTPLPSRILRYFYKGSPPSQVESHKGGCLKSWKRIPLVIAFRSKGEAAALYDLQTCNPPPTNPPLVFLTYFPPPPFPDIVRHVERRNSSLAAWYTWGSPNLMDL